MTDKQFQAVMDDVHALRKKWFPILGLNQWRNIPIVFRRDCSSDKENSMAEVAVSWEYRHGTIFIYGPKWFEYMSASEYHFVHECCHFLVAEMRCWGPPTVPSEDYERRVQHEERVVTDLAMAFLRARKSK